MADRVDRLERLRKSLIGITIDTWLEPSRALVDKAVGFAEEQCLGPLELSKCTSREAEMRSEKRDPETFRLEKLNIKVTKPQVALLAETSTDLHVRTCMQRRALAFHMAGIATVVVLDWIISRFFGHMMRSDSPGQQPVTLSQIVDADRTLWVLVAQETRGKVLTSGTPLPIDAAVLANTFSSPPAVGQLRSLLDVLPSENPARGKLGDFSNVRGHVASPPLPLRQHVELLGYRIQLPPGNLDPVNFACEAPEALAVEAFCGRGR
eukprot:s15453_g1.t1